MCGSVLGELHAVVCKTQTSFKKQSMWYFSTNVIDFRKVSHAGCLARSARSVILVEHIDCENDVGDIRNCLRARDYSPLPGPT